MRPELPGAARALNALDPGLPIEVAIGFFRDLLERNESAELYDEGGRAELAQRGREEIAIIPLACRLQMSDDEGKAAITEAVKYTGAAGM